jgi:multicomponent Na+:H+ antiporter subunit D
MAAGCVVIGIFPGLLYSVLPFPVDYHPYTTTHVVTQYQLLLFSALAFTFLKVTGIYPPELRSVNLDVDWIYRRALPALIRWIARLGGGIGERLHAAASVQLDRAYRLIYHLTGPTGVFARTWTTGAIAFWAVLGLFGFLLLYLWGR